MTNLEMLTNAILKAGLISDDTLDEFKRWGFSFPLNTPATLPTPEDVARHIESALQSEGLVLSRVTDLDVLAQYISTVKVGKLHVEMGDQEADFDVPYGESVFHEYIIPYKGDNIQEEMVNGQTYLVRDDSLRVYFSSVRDLFFDNRKAFMLCTGAVLGS